MTDYKLVPMEPTLDMLCEGTDVYGSEDCAETDVLGIYKAMLAAAPDVESDIEAWLAPLSPEDRMIEEIKSMATNTYLRHCTSAKGQQVSASHNMSSHLIWATKRWLEINETAPVTKPVEQQPEVLAKGYFHPLPDENDYEFHDAENFPNGSDCPACVPAMIVGDGVEKTQFEPAQDVTGLVEALEQCITSMLDSGYRADAVVIRAARAALSAFRQGGEE